MAKNADKLVLSEKLRNSLDWCNAHNDNAQVRFDNIVDLVIKDGTRNAEMKSLYPVLLQEDLAGYRPGITLTESVVDLHEGDFLDSYFQAWCAKYENAWKTLPSQREAKPKGAVTDQALIKMVEPKAGDGKTAGEWASHHTLFMSAENVGGNLLEEYIYTKTNEYDWIWCRGETLTAVDFCSTKKQQFIQIKNKSNTENSSSKGFREDHHAAKWYRMEASRKNGQIITHWPELIEIIKRGTDKTVPDDLMTEESYLDFIRTASEQNPLLITDKER